MPENTGEKIKSPTLETLQLAEQALKSVNKRMREELEKANDLDNLDEIHRKYEGIRSKCFDQIFTAEVNYWNSGDYIPEGQSFNEEMAQRLQKILKEVENVSDENTHINITWDGQSSGGGMYENMRVEEFRKRLENNIKANLKKPGEFVREDADILSPHGRDEVNFEEYEVRKGTPEKVGIYSTYH